MQPDSRFPTFSGSLKDSRLWLAAGLLLVSVMLFMLLGKGGNDWPFLLAFRGKKLLALLMVAYAIGVSTMLFQTLTHNPILTPAILGFDSLYVFIQTLLVAVLGSTVFVQLVPVYKFGVEVLIMIGGSLLLFQMLLRQGGGDLARMILIGVVFGVLFRSLTSLLQRLIDPEEFAVVQANSFAQFSAVNENILWFALGICLISAVLLWRERHRLDVYLLGRDQAVNLGVAYHRTTLYILLWIAVLVATATAMVGPVSFFGLLVCALANDFSRSQRHGTRLPMVFFVSGIMLVGGQAVFEHVLGMKGVLSVVIEFLGGLMFLYLILKRKYD